MRRGVKKTPRDNGVDKITVVALVISIICFVLNILVLVLANLDKIIVA